MDFVDLSKHVYDEGGNLIRFESPELEEKLGPDPCNQIGGYLVPSKDENHQTFIVLDFKEYRLKIYKRERRNKQSTWEEWKFYAYID